MYLRIVKYDLGARMGKVDECMYVYRWMDGRMDGLLVSLTVGIICMSVKHKTREMINK